MSKVFAKIAAALGGIMSYTTVGACSWGWLEEPEMPKSLIK